MLPLLSSSNSSPRLRSSPQSMRSSSRKALTREDSNISDKDKPRSVFTAGQAFALAALCSSLAAVATALVAICFFSNSYDVYADHLVASTTRSVISRRRVRSLSTNTAQSTSTLTTLQHHPSPEPVMTTAMPSKSATLLLSTTTHPKVTEGEPVVQKFPFSNLPEPVADPNSPRPHIAWLMSFPNRYVNDFRSSNTIFDEQCSPLQWQCTVVLRLRCI